MMLMIHVLILMWCSQMWTPMQISGYPSCYLE
uniref:Uncharacterized protein n=1 Tax=Setaria viridis TaxID=4556 RepID=A0A4U6V1Y5_SETVI|nr:hypothetical protein SEVIR_4G170203v2 [Setaria viridis]